MGVAASQPTENNPIEKQGDTIGDLHKQIIESGNKLIKKYKDRFLNEDFCNNLQFVVGKKLAELDVDSLEKLNNKISSSSSVSVYTKASESKNQEYVLKSLGDNLSELGDLHEYFDGTITFDKDSIETIPRGLKIKFINDKIRSGIMKELQNYNSPQKGGAENDEDPAGDQAEEKKIAKRLRGIVENENNGNVNKEKTLQDADEIYQKIKSLTKEIDGFEDDDPTSTDKITTEGTDGVATEGTDGVATEGTDGVATEGTDKITTEGTDGVATEGTDGVATEGTDDSMNQSSNNSHKNNKTSPNVVKKNDYKVIKYTKKGDKSIFTKTVLCKAIIDHYKVRINIISAILSVIPYDFNSTELSGFCEDRLRALREGTICLPDSSFEKMKKYSIEEGIQKLSKTINNFTKGRCEKFSGFLMKLSTEQLESLKKGSTGLNKQYKDSYLALKRNYRENLQKLLDILGELGGIHILNNASLNNLSEKTRDLIQAIYNNCQLHYYNAIIALIHANLNAIKEQQEEDDKQKTLKIYADHIQKRATSDEN